MCDRFYGGGHFCTPDPWAFPKRPILNMVKEFEVVFFADIPQKQLNNEIKLEKNEIGLVMSVMQM